MFYFKFVLLTLFLAIEKIHGICPRECNCEGTVPSGCPSGASLIQDGCRCCFVCAKQANELCNDETEPCDSKQGFICDRSQNPQSEWGVCRLPRERSCVHGGILLVSGVAFNDSCSRKCRCFDGTITCFPKCDSENQRPPFKLCPNARLQKVKGQCCAEWICGRLLGAALSSGERLRRESTARAQDERGTRRQPLPIPEEAIITNRGNSNVVYEWDGGADGDELSQFQTEHYGDGAGRRRESESWDENNFFPGDEDEERHHEHSNVECLIRATEWSACSRTCGLGMSNRVSNDNPECRMQRETRLCRIRRCRNSQRHLTNGRRCHPQKRTSKRISYIGCRSVEPHRTKFCGTSCNNANKCCQPKKSKTVTIRFRCRHRSSFKKEVMVVTSCRCFRRRNFQNSPPTTRQSIYENALFANISPAEAQN